MLTVDERKYLDKCIEDLSKKIDEKFADLKLLLVGSIEATKENTKLQLQNVALQIEQLKEKNVTWQHNHELHFDETKQLKVELSIIPEKITAARTAIMNDMKISGRFGTATIISIVGTLTAVVAVIISVTI